MAVVKGNAHGHGAVKASLALEAHGADAFAVACMSEAIELREAGIQAPILVLGWTPAECARQLADYGIAQSVMDEDYALELNEAAAAAGKVVDIHAKLDTGMSRTGIFAQENPAEAAQIVSRIANLPNLNIKGIFTHYAAADMPEKDDFTAWQLSNYKAVLRALETLGFDKPVVHHTGNSACILNHPETYFDMVRMGDDDVWPLSRRCIPEGWPVEASADTKSPRCSGETAPGRCCHQLWLYRSDFPSHKNSGGDGRLCRLLSEKSQ